MPQDKDFFQKVHEVVKQIPRGRVTTYGIIARCLGTGKSARTVGWAMNSAASTLENIPAHRVVNRNGMLTGKHAFGTATKMQELLEAEGISVKDDTVQDFKNILWDPTAEYLE